MTNKLLLGKDSLFDLNNKLVEDLLQALGELNGWGSVEVFVQNGKVTQITKRAIKKTNHLLKNHT